MKSRCRVGEDLDSWTLVWKNREENFFPVGFSWWDSISCCVRSFVDVCVCVGVSRAELEEVKERTSERELGAGTVSAKKGASRAELKL